MLLLYHATILISLINSEVFLVEYLGLLYSIVICSITLNKSGKSGHPCLIPDLRGKLSAFHYFKCDLTCGFVICGPYYVEYIPSILC